MIANVTAELPFRHTFLLVELFIDRKLPIKCLHGQVLLILGLLPHTGHIYVSFLFERRELKLFHLRGRFLEEVAVAVKKVALFGWRSFHLDLSW